MVRRSKLIETPARIPQSRPNLIGFATLARLAYFRGDPLIDQAVKGFGWGDGAWTLPATPLEPQVLCLDYDEWKIIVFEGTTTQSQTLTYCLNHTNTVYNAFPGKILTGFGTIFQTVWPKVELLLQDIGSRKAIFVGHSMGGAMAALSSYLWRKWQRDKFHACITFGCPRVGNGEWVFKADFPWYRVSTLNDPVTHSPPRQVLLPGFLSATNWWSYIEYEHGGYALTVEPNGDFRAGSAPDLGLADLFDAAQANNWHLDEIAKPHSMANYVFYLAKTNGPFRFWRHKYFSEVNNELNSRESLEWRMLGFND